ncbi:MAG: hypothetical protein WC464_04615 [Bdellovibrionales bacterium]
MTARRMEDSHVHDIGQARESTLRRDNQWNDNRVISKNIVNGAFATLAASLCGDIESVWYLGRNTLVCTMIYPSP